MNISYNGEKLFDNIEDNFKYFYNSYQMAEKPNNGLHKTWLNFRKLKGILKSIGFVNIIRVECAKSDITEFCFLDRSHMHISLYLEAKKP